MTTPLVVSPRFVISCRNFADYPVNLVRHDNYDSALLLAYKESLGENEVSLFEGLEYLKIPVRDIDDEGAIHKRNILTMGSLDRWLGDQFTPDPNDPIRYLGSATTKRDPRCRFVFLVTPNSERPLEINKESLQRIFTYHQVMPAMLDFLFVYGSDLRKREARYSGFRTESTIRGARSSSGAAIDPLGRSDKRYQFCYNIKSVVSDSPGSGIPETFVVRQATIYHQFDIGTHRQLWIIGDPHAKLKETIGQKYNVNRPKPESFSGMPQSFKSSLDIHLVCIRWAQTQWRSVLRKFDDKVDHLTLVLPNLTTSTNALREVQRYEERIDEAATVLDLNTTTLTALSGWYSRLIADLKKDKTLSFNVQDAMEQVVEEFVLDVEDHIRETQMQYKQLNILAKLLSDQRTNLLLRIQASTTASQEATAKKQEELSIIMVDLAKQSQEFAKQSQRDTVAMRIITVITLLYLPPTFVSTFFSTDIVKYQGGESYSALALGRWWTVTGPLMILTFIGALSWYLIEERRAKQTSRELPPVGRLIPAAGVGP